MLKVSAFPIFIASLIILAVIQLLTRPGGAEQASAVAVLHAGDVLRVDLAREPLPTRGSRWPWKSTVAIRDLSQNRCGIVVFFESTCSVTEDISPAWRGISQLRRDKVSVPVRWVSVNPGDSGAQSFLATRQLPGPPLYVQSAADLGRLGVPSYPRIYLLGPGGTYLTQLSRDPNEIRSFPSVCLEPGV